MIRKSGILNHPTDKARICRNFWNHGTHLVKRGGADRYNASSLGANTLSGMFRYYGGQAPELVVVHDGLPYRGDDSAGTFSLIPTYQWTCNMVNGLNLCNLGAGGVATKNVVVGDIIHLGLFSSLVSAIIDDENVNMADSWTYPTGAWPMDFVRHLTVGIECYFAADRNNLILSNGTDTPMIYDGTIITPLGYGTPDTPTVDAVLPGGGFIGAGTYKWAILWQYANGDSEVSTGVEQVCAGADAVRLNIARGPQRCVGRVVMRAEQTAGIYGDYQIVAIVNNNTATQYTDTHVSTDLTAFDYRTYDGAPPLGTFCETINNHLWLANSDTEGSGIYFSAWGEPDYFPAENFISITTADGEQLNGIRAYGIYLYAFKESSDIRVDPVTADWALVSIGAGASSQRSIVATPNGLLHANRLGVWAIVSEKDHELSDDIEDIFRAWSNDAIKLNIGAAERMAACYYKGFYLLSYPAGIATLNSTTLVLNLSTGQWGYFDGYSPKDWAVGHGAGDEWQLWYCYSGAKVVGDLGIVLKADYLRLDHGSEFDAEYYTTYQDFEAPHLVKSLQHALVNCNVDDGRLEVRYDIDNSTVMGFISFTPSPTYAVWDSFSWDDGTRWEGRAGDLLEVQDDIPWGYEGRRISLGVRHRGESDCVIYDMIVELDSHEFERST